MLQQPVGLEVRRRDASDSPPRGGTGERIIPILSIMGASPPGCHRRPQAMPAQGAGLGFEGHAVKACRSAQGAGPGPLLETVIHHEEQAICS